MQQIQMKKLPLITTILSDTTRNKKATIRLVLYESVKQYLIQIDESVFGSDLISHRPSTFDVDSPIVGEVAHPRHGTLAHEQDTNHRQGTDNYTLHAHCQFVSVPNLLFEKVSRSNRNAYKPKRFANLIYTEF